MVTVESELLEALGRALYLGNQDVTEIAELLGYRVGSRTDRGVSALANVISIHLPGSDTPSPLALLGRANELLTRRKRPLWVTAWAQVPDDFNPRNAISRTYCYLLPGTDLDVPAMTEAADCLMGEHDFGSFCRSDGKTTRLTLDSVKIREQEPGLTLRFTAPAFRWQMVRRMTAALVAVGRARTTIDEVKAALEEPDPDGGWGAAPPTGLILERVEYEGLEWHEGPGANMAGKWARQRENELTLELGFTRRLG